MVAVPENGRGGLSHSMGFPDEFMIFASVQKRPQREFKISQGKQYWTLVLHVPHQLKKTTPFN